MSQKVFVIVGISKWFNAAGPVGVFTTREAAEAEIKECSCSQATIFEMEVR